MTAKVYTSGFLNLYGFDVEIFAKMECDHELELTKARLDNDMQI